MKKCLRFILVIRTRMMMMVEKLSLEDTMKIIIPVKSLGSLFVDEDTGKSISIVSLLERKLLNLTTPAPQSILAHLSSLSPLISLKYSPPSPNTCVDED